MKGLQSAGAVRHFLLLLAAVFLKCEGDVWDKNYTLYGYKWTTRGGFLFVEAGSPPRYLRQRPKRREIWYEHSWIVHNTEKPDDVELLPVSSELEDQIVEEVNVRRAKTLLGAYFDPERPTAFGTTPPAAHLSTVQYKERLEQASERFVQHFIFDHHNNDELFPYAPAGENLRRFRRVDTYMRTDGTETLEKVKENECDSPATIVSEAFGSWFERELQYYRHYEIYKEKVHDNLLDVHFKQDIRSNYTLTEEQREWKLNLGVQIGHAVSIIAKNMNSVGCGLSRKTILVTDQYQYKGRRFHKYRVQDLMACKFGGGFPEEGKLLYDIDETVLQLHGISKSLYDLPGDD